jgi:HTH-type transcriptional regulator/antitoxin HigA
MNVMHFASDVGVHPAVVAGRVRFERNNYRLLSQFVGSGEVRQQFFS